MTARILLLTALFIIAAPSGADDREQYNRRAAAADVSTFRHLDFNHDGRVTREEAKGDVDFMGRFNDIDTGRDGAIDRSELRRYIEQRYEVRPEAVGMR